MGSDRRFLLAWRVAEVRLVTEPPAGEHSHHLEHVDSSG
jgi:hypothetical protein